MKSKGILSNFQSPRSGDDLDFVGESFHLHQVVETKVGVEIVTRPHFTSHLKMPIEDARRRARFPSRCRIRSSRRLVLGTRPIVQFWAGASLIFLGSGNIGIMKYFN
ncbi:hypothetical protein ACOSQ4_005916 [Xanthoceras sorbifolium]